MRDLNEIQCFVKAIELKSLTAAAKVLGLPKSSVSRKISDLEKRLGITLMTRTTRALRLTESGRLFFENSAQALKQLDSAELTLDGSRQEVEGLLRITAPEELSTGPFNDLIATFLKKYPKTKVEISLTNKLVDMISEGFDFGFRVGALKDSSLIAKKLQTLNAYFVASPEYLRLRGTPKTFNDLTKHDCICFAPSGGSILKWTLKGPGGTKEYSPEGRLVVNNMLSLKEATVKGLGIALIPTYIVAEEIKNKTLKQVCPEWESHGYPFHLVYAGQRFLSPKMRAFIDHASEHLLL